MVGGGVTPTMPRSVGAMSMLSTGAAMCSCQSASREQERHVDLLFVERRAVVDAAVLVELLAVVRR